MLTANAYLDALNPEQRQAVEYGLNDQGNMPGGPLLVIAGAGSGKTNTLAHRDAVPVCQRRRPAADPADDVFAACGSRNDEARRAHRAEGDWRQGRRNDGSPAVGRY